jgi:hypothetical protein
VDGIFVGRAAWTAEGFLDLVERVGHAYNRSKVY